MLQKKSAKLPIFLLFYESKIIDSYWATKLVTLFVP